MTVHFNDSIEASGTKSIQFEGEFLPGNGKLGFSLYRNFGKRIFDVLFVIATAPVALVLIAWAAFLTMFDGHNPFYRQKRVGRGGRPFWLLKIRTMVPDADEKLEAHLRHDADARREWNRKQKLDDDPRITWLGAFLRKSSLDELPQLWNVLMGEMSIVGPRPMMINQRPLYPSQAYYKLRPGITGNWQISERNECSFAGRAAFDDDYEARLDFATDLGILARTIGVVLRCTGR